MSDYKSDYLPDAEIQDSGYYGIPALQAPPERAGKVPGGVKREGTPSGSLESLKEELDWLRSRVERLEQRSNYND